MLTLGLWAHVAVILGFLLIVLHSKHLHIFAAPINVYFSRRPDGLGPLLEMYSGTEKIDFEDPADDAVFGRGRIEDFTWKGLLDMATCTECGRCQSQCPAWNTEKPLSPKLMIMNLRDHAFTKAPYITATQKKLDGKNVEFGEIDDEVLATLPERVQAEVARPLIGERDFDPHRDTDGYDPSGHRSHEGPVIDVDALWSCTTCGACVNQCPVDIEHIDHFIDMRRHQVMIATEFPNELNSLFKNLENKGNPWGMNASKRNDWISEVDFEVPVFGMEGEDEIPADVEYLFWVGCAGAYEDRAKQTTKDVAELLNVAGVKYMVLGEGETCTGDPARRAGNEFLFQMQAMQNVEVLNEVKAKRIVVTCPHCMNTIGREYPQLGRQLRGRPPQPAARHAAARRPAAAADPRGRDRDLPRPVLPGPAQQGLRAAPRARRVRARRQAGGDGPHRRQVVLLRRRWRADVDGGATRHPGQPEPLRRGDRNGCQQDRRRLPVLLGDAARRRDRSGPGGRRGRPRGRGARRGLAAAGLGQVAGAQRLTADGNSREGCSDVLGGTGARDRSDD